ncbi:MAG: sodium:solute symporter [Clostridia bacterium]|nr:sodium:solute symporter [Clostridia bacterium]
MVIKIVFLVVFFAVMIGVGIMSRRHATDVTGFVLGGRNVGPWLTAFAYGTSYFSAVIFIGYAGQFGWKFGVASTWIGLGNAFIGSLLAWAILGRRTRIMTQHLKSATMPEFFGKRFNSSALKVFASVIVFVFMIPYTASLYNGLSRLFQMAFNIDYVYCVIGMAVLTGIYVIIGGYMATAINDFIQGIIMLFGIIAVILAVLANHGGLSGALVEMSKVPADPGTTDLQGAFSSFLGPEPLFLLFVVILTSLGTWGLPQMVGKFYAIKTEKAIDKGMVASTAFAVIVAGGCYFLGGFGRLYTPEMNGDKIIFDSIVPNMLVGLPDVLIGIVVILVLSASMSTLSSLVLTSSSTLTLDFIGQFNKKMGEKTKLLIMRLLVVVFIAISSIIAIVQAKSTVTFIAQLMGISWGAMAGAFLAPYLYALYWKKVTKLAVWVNFIVGVGIMAIQMLCPQIMGNSIFFKSSIHAGVLAMLLGFIIVPVVSLITPKLDSGIVDPMFTCYEKEITVKVKHSLSDDD